MSRLRPECGTGGPGTKSLPDKTALFLIAESVNRRRSLIYGRLDDNNGKHCAMGCFWEDNPNQYVNESLVDEVAAVNDSVPKSATPKERWKTVQRWLRFRLASMVAK
jgi:hypothetical protein